MIPFCRKSISDEDIGVVTNEFREDFLKICR